MIYYFDRKESKRLLSLRWTIRIGAGWTEADFAEVDLPRSCVGLPWSEALRKAHEVWRQ